jgi:hypothetical protein
VDSARAFFTTCGRRWRAVCTASAAAAGGISSDGCDSRIGSSTMEEGDEGKMTVERHWLIFR